MALDAGGHAFEYSPTMASSQRVIAPGILSLLKRGDVRELLRRYSDLALAGLVA